ncbi:MAG: hypothetical protein UU21_C0001G0058 [Candidatus Levybacteria bacterium GW2011_GWA2_40_8]|nr:MAG: hypothetical protein UU21_C0001G0058 [Candidatus Levybacteria bacterium GW2011_GWA2_40_8]
MVLSERVQEGLRLRNAYHILLLWTPNIFHPQKLAANIRHPIGEVIHTSHKQRPVEMKEGVEYHVVEHRLVGKLVTVDVVTPTTFPKGIIPRVRQLFDIRFYYGHDRDFPHPFMLVNRTFVTAGFDQQTHLQRVLG